MSITIKGRYYNGKVILEKAAPALQAEVLVIFQDDGKEPERMAPRFGAAEGIVTYMADDFDEPLEDLKEYM